MIKYNIKCKNEHVFESWFVSSAKCDELLGTKAIECPVCGDTHTSKALMAPNISKKGSRPKSDYAKSSDNEQQALEWVEKNCEDVGERFADEVRAIHYGDKEERGIHGTATAHEQYDLHNEGIDVINLGKKRNKH